MARRQWTLLFVSDDRTTIRQFRLSRELVRASIAGALLLLSLLTSLAIGFIVQEGSRARADRLERENGLLLSEVTQIRKRMANLGAVLGELSRRDEQYRLLAGLDPIDAEVRQVGVGGPGMATMQASALWKVDPQAGLATFSAASDLDMMLRRARLLEVSWAEARDTLERKVEQLLATPSIVPVTGYISSSFSRQRWHPLLERVRPHTGMDIVAPRGTPIRASARGTVRFAERQGGYGLMVEIDHGFGYVTRYAHAQRILVREGQLVKRGDTIAEVGSTGLALGPHLHYEVLVNGVHADPRRFMFDEPARAE
jgi:murein DD-endopeptidase MepM/ murein hydrolase activator NlpD